MKTKVIARGAEAIIYKTKDSIVKERIRKKYRHPKLDKSIIKKRTKAETKLLRKVSLIIDVPRVIDSNENKIFIEEIAGDKLSIKLNSYPKEKQKEVMKKVGESIAKIHKAGIIHGDLTTSNMIYFNDEKLYMIDFGLGYFNGKIEDKAVDVHVLKEALNSKHFQNANNLFKWFKQGYLKINKDQGEKVFERLSAIEKRGRYKK